MTGSVNDFFRRNRANFLLRRRDSEGGVGPKRRAEAGRLLL